METIIDNWAMIFAILVIILVAVLAIVRFFKLPTEEQLDKVREWLLYAVTEAEKDLGGGTGQLKLRQVYDLFTVRFPWLVKVIAFSTFSDLVDDALVEMRAMLSQNEAIQEYVAGDLK